MDKLRIHDLGRLSAVLDAERFLLFKHSTVCSISDHAFKAYERFLVDHPDVPSGWIEVREQRDGSQHVARHTGVVHESPQALWIRDGQVAWHASHWDITQDALAAAVGA
jgi:bacillithiol system protein YtxJ